MKFFQNIQNYDMHVKTLDGVTQQTLLGAAMTIVAAFVVLMLFISEVREFTTPNYVTRMQADNSAGQADAAIRLHFDVDFLTIPCDKISFQQEVVRGKEHLHVVNHPEEDIKKEFKSYPESKAGPGCWIHGSVVTDKIAGNFVFKVQPDPGKPQAPKKLEAGGAITLQELQRLQMPPLPEMPSLNHRVNNIMFFPYSESSDSRDPADITRLRKDLIDMYSSKGMLTNHMNVVEEGTGMQNYHIQVIPAEIEPGQKKQLIVGDVYQYSVSQRSIGLEYIAGGTISLAGQTFTEVYGIVFTYDFYPLKLFTEVRNESFVDFLASLFGILGGVITVIGLVERCVAQGSKAMMGKLD
jgi:hypothetical protein